MDASSMLKATARLVVPRSLRPTVRAAMNKLLALEQRDVPAASEGGEACKEEDPRVAARRDFAMSYYRDKLANIEQWAHEQSEWNNFCFDITDASKLYLAHLLSLTFGIAARDFQRYFSELSENRELHSHCEDLLKRTIGPDVRFSVGRRIGWYAIARALKPKTIVETGVEHGIGSCVMCSALQRNSAQGHPGRYYGTDIRSDAGELFQPPYSDFGTILYGDSIESLKSLQDPIDLLINDSDHSPEYEAREYETIQPKLGSKAVILGDNSHVTTKLAEFSEATGRRFAFFAERPKDHWYPGSGIGISAPGLPPND